MEINKHVDEATEKLSNFLNLSGQALQVISQGVVICGVDRKVIWCNQAFTSITGYSLDEMRGRTCSILQGPLTSTETLERIRAALESHNDFYGEVQNYRKDGLPYWNELSISPVRDERGVITHYIGVNRNIDPNKAAEQQLRKAQDALVQSAMHTQAIVDNMMDGVITLNAQGQIEFFNKAATEIFGYTQKEVQGQQVDVLMPQPHHARHHGYMQHYYQTGEQRIIGIPRDLQGQRKDGTTFPLNIRVTRIERAGEPVFVGIVRDITQRLSDEEEIRRLAFYDPLTGLPNRRLLLDRVKQAMSFSERNGTHGALMFLDLDHFKQLNDSLGHDIGDELLKQVASRISMCLRENDSVARLGGDEFVVLLESLSGNESEAAGQAEMVAQKVRDVLNQPFSLLHHSYNTTPSIGIVIFIRDHETIDDLLKKADVAMYQAKAAGRNTVRFFDPAMQSVAEARMALARDIRSGLALGEFQLYYQVQVDRSGVPSGAEALVRWTHPLRGMVSPAQFIPLAEETGLILPLGRWVLETACEQLKRWSSDARFSQWILAVNVSAIEMASEDYVACVQDILQASGANPNRLKLELTESLLAKDIEGTIVKMHSIKALGVGFSLDDFGTGFSSLNYLKKLPMSQLKIDQSFVRDLEHNENDAAIARTVVALGHSLGLGVIAEGVETEAQRDILLGYGCDKFQGYLFGRPMAIEVLEKLPFKN